MVVIPQGYVHAGVGDIISDTYKVATQETLENGLGFVGVLDFDDHMVGLTINWPMQVHFIFIKPMFAAQKSIPWGHSTPEPAPISNDYPGIQELVIKDMQDRLAFGIEKYGGPLKPFDGRRTLREIYQEKMDELIYWRKLLFEVEGK